MAKLSKKDVLHVASLAKLHLSADELEKYLKQLSKVVDYVGELSEVDTENVEPTNQTTGLENVYRVDELESAQSLSQDEALAGTENTLNGYFKVGTVLKGKIIK